MFDFINSKKKKEALENLEVAQLRYKEIGDKASQAAQKLYEKRKEAIGVIEKLTDYLRKQPDFGGDNLKQIADAIASIRFFTEAIRNEEEEKKINDSTSKYTKRAAAGTIAGATVWALGPSAAMAIATTFGTAATGTAISTLTGVAATNAALAWLGGGALAAGGGGMAAGSAILAMAGPIGLAIGGVSVGIAAFSASKKNSQIASEAEKTKIKINNNIDKIKKAIRRIDDLCHEISVYKDRLISIIITNDMRSHYQEIVEYIQKLCVRINEKISI